MPLAANTFQYSDMDELFSNSSKEVPADSPLAVKMRPESLKDFVGQEHIVGQGKILRKMIEEDKIPSIVFYGPPGCGKTALAMIIANRTKKHFHHLNAVTCTVSDVREVISSARERRRISGKGTILFLDEIAHFNKNQQDALMKDVEDGVITLVAATTHNPFFYVNSPLLSRSTILELNPLSEEDVKIICKRALSNSEKGLGKYNVKMTDKALDYIVKISSGDARRCLNALETGVLLAKQNKDGYFEFDLDIAKEAVQKKLVVYDKNEDSHYDTISAFIKSMRGSDPDAALYYLAKMIVAGEDPRFIARRIVICAAEDVGNAEPLALILAQSAYQAVEVIGMPEAKIILAQATVYIATCPKSNASYKAVMSAIEDVQTERTQSVPKYLRSTGYKGARKLGSGVGYLYPHDFPGHYVPQKYMEKDKKFYLPSDSGYERKIQFFLKHLERLKKEYEKTHKKENSSGKK